MKQQHYFIGINVPTFISEQSVAFLEANKDDFPFRVWTHMCDYHITLAFLGAVKEEKVNKLAQELVEIAKNYKTFKLQVGPLHVFGVKERPRVVFLQVSDEEKLAKLQKEIYEKCVQLGFSLDKRPYHPHITIAKRWNGESPFQFDRYMNKEIVTQEENELTISKINLYMIHPNSVPKYEVIEMFSFS
ncbi:RNA 2',3'-cyclic phosphodiesterase [Bacillus sp. CGMCC 1.16541]|uniref:RNA 2',3'-cyclic phosphodiesterase n=1 Tax=Bacillus sp. CGMCC 1.16541 TaxID=2185143 RepID=UPI000D73C3ED|nr:RNA 2',3'-cyclic phosphodiesterase [Bacillus sp. CGMCC 1.16541]